MSRVLGNSQARFLGGWGLVTVSVYPTRVWHCHMYNLRILTESESYLIGHEYEVVVLVEKKSGKQHVIADHHGDPNCAIIDPNENWFLIGGEGITYFDFEKGSINYFRGGGHSSLYSPCWFVHDMRLESANEVRILFDPWSEYASMWLMNCLELKIRKVQDGPHLEGKPYQDKVEF